VSPARNIQRQAADEQRFTRLAETTGPRVLAYLSRRVDPPGDAADVLAEVLATAWRRVGDLPADDEEAAAWLFGIARGPSPTTAAAKPAATPLPTASVPTSSIASAKRPHRPMRLSPFATPSPACPPTTGSCSP